MKHLITSIVLGCSLLAGCESFGHGDPKDSEGGIGHTVFFKLNNPDDATELIADCDRDLQHLDSVDDYICGRHAGVGQTAANTEYDVGLFIGFDSPDAYQSYLDSAAHLAFVSKWRSRWEWIRVYDIQDLRRD